MEVTRVGEEHGRLVISSKVTLSEERLAKMEKEAAIILSISEESFKAEL